MEKILTALECDLNDLHNSLQIVNERPEAIRRPPGAPDWQAIRWSSQESTQETVETGGLNVYRILGLDRPLPPQEEQALGEMLGGFHKLVRYFHSTISPPPAGKG